MLEIIVFNVGDGDAALLRLNRPDKNSINILIDSGRPELPEHPLSQRATAVEHLREWHIDHLDVMILTHLHIDHIGGAADILDAMPVRRMIVPYLPTCRAETLPRQTEGELAEKWNELCRVLLRWQLTVEKARQQGTVIATAWEEPVFSADGLTVEEILPGKSILHQQMLYDRIYQGEQIPAEEWYPVAKCRNPESLMEHITYGGRRILFCGDRYAETFSDGIYGPCDLVKLPHHGDPKAMTEELLHGLHPQYALISCQLDPRKKKDRPNEEVVALLKKNGVEVLCTENRPLPSLPMEVCRRIVCRIQPDGGMTVEKQRIR